MTVLALCCFGLAPGLYPTLAIVAAINFLFPMNGIIAAHLQLATPPALRGRVSALMILGSNVLGLTLGRSEEHTSELQSLMPISYAVFRLNQKTPTSNYLSY